MMMKNLKHISLILIIGLKLIFPVALYGQIAVVDLSNANNILCNFSIPSFSIKDTTLPVEYENNNIYSYIKIFDESTGLVDSVGFPELPFFMYNFEIPYNSNNINVSMTDMQYETYYLENHILPCQSDIDKNSNYENFQFDFNEEFYSSNNFFMPVNYQLVDTFVIRSVKGVRLAIFPFKYNPYRKQLQVLRSAKIEIGYQAGQNRLEPLQSDTWENVYSSLFVNHSPSLRAPATEKYLILSLPEYEDAIQYFANYKRSLGMDVNIHTIEQNQQNSTDIKQIVQDYYDDLETRPDYILLVGDYPEIPAYSGFIYNDSVDNNDPITDVPYAFLEGDDDYRDALIGRWPVHSSLDVQTITNKTIYMEMNMHLYEKKAVFIAGTGNNSTMQHYFEQGHEDAIGYTFEPNGYICTQLNQPNSNTALSYLNDNPLLYIYSGHGYFYSWGKIGQNNGTPWYITSSFIDQGAHKTFPSVFAFACLTGNFACSGTSIAESWINNNNGAVTYFGSSLNTNVVSDYRIEKKLFGDAFYDENTIGGIIALGMNRYYDAFLTWGNRARRYMKSYNLMGDPSFKVRGLGCAEDYYIERMKLEMGDNQYYIASVTITFDGNNQAGYGSELILQAGQEIVFKDGFTAAAGSEVTAQIEECIDNRTMFNHYESKSDFIGKKQIMNIPKIELDSFDIKVFPNPIMDILSVSLGSIDDKSVSIQILDIFGQVVRDVGDCKTTDISIDISQLPSGCYYVVTTIGKEKNHKCIIKL